MHGLAPHSFQQADACDVRRTILGMLHRGGASHVGPCMSMVEILMALYGAVEVERIRESARDRDRVFVSKGHSAAAVYAVMRHVGLLTDDQLAGYHLDGSFLAGHVSHYVDNVEHSTGALGHGLSVACGVALGIRALRFRGVTQRWPLLSVVVGDGELQEGSVWEALMFAVHQRLPILVIVDNNRISSITKTAEVMDLNPLVDRFRGFGLSADVVDGHSLESLQEEVDKYRSDPFEKRGDNGYAATPRVLIANTVKGKGVPFAEGEPVWHYRPLSDEALATALTALEAEESRSSASEVS